MSRPPRRAGRPRRDRAFDLASLNPPQLEAVLHDDGPLLVLAGAGSGKTRVIVFRIARLIRDGVAPENILGVTFTNKSAHEMRERLRALVGAESAEVQLSTFHALGLRILREESKAAGLRSGFCIYDTSDQLSLVRELMRQVKVADRRLDVGRVLDLILRTKRARLPEVELRYHDDYELAAFDLYPRYVAQMRAFNAVDFDDLILRALDVLGNVSVRREWSTRFSYILVDEYQDTSPDQLALLRVLAGTKHNVCVVGDDDQSIYAWRGAEPGNILAFAEHFRGAREIILDQNYRSTENILSAANSVIANNPVRKPKCLWSDKGVGEPVSIYACGDDEDEATFVVDSVLGLLSEGVRPSQIAVLYRANGQSRVFEGALALEHIAFRVVGGQAFFERKEVRDAFAYLAVAQNPSDEVSLRRIVNTPPRGIGPSSVERLVQFGERTNQGLFEALRCASQVAGLPERAVRAAKGLVGALTATGQRLRQAKKGELSTLARELFDELGMRAAILASDDPPMILSARLENLDEVLHSLAVFERGAVDGRALLCEYLRAAALAAMPGEEETTPEEQLTLMTLHSAKGLEFDYVFLVGIEEDWLPHKKTLEAGDDLGEERRLFYVGMTRAKRRLWLTWARRRTRHGSPTPRAASRFLSEIPDSAGVRRHNRDEPHADAESEQRAQDFFKKMRLELQIED